MSDGEKEEKKSKTNWGTIPALIAAIAALVNSFYTPYKSENKNDLMLQSMFNYSTREISNLNEKYDPGFLIIPLSSDEENPISPCQ